MPRILPRLLKKLKNSHIPETFDRFSLDKHRFRGKSLWKPLPPNPFPSFKPSDHGQSILLTPGNPITSSRDYVRRKSLPPRVYIPENAQKRKKKNAYEVYDKPRRMTDGERDWWASPYLRMLSTPLRRCLQTQQLLPSAFLIRLGVFQAPSSQPLRLFSPSSPPEALLLPDGLEHSKFKGRRSGKAGYVLCWKDAVEHLRVSGAYKRIAFNSRIPFVLLDQIRHLLRLRVLQELQLVIDALQFRPRTLVIKDRPLVRRLTRAEWHELKATGIMPATITEHAMAVIVVPPLNRHPVTKKRPKGIMSSLPPPEDPEDSNLSRKFERPSLPLCTLHLIHPIPETHKIENKGHPEDIYFSDHHARSRVPLYNGVTLFPDPTQRAALLDLLRSILAIERKARARNQRRTMAQKEEEVLSSEVNQASNSPQSLSSIPSPSLASSAEDSTGVDNRASHAFLLYSDAHTALTADMAGVGLALWRIPMFEGMGWESKPQGDVEGMAREASEKGGSEFNVEDSFGSPWVKRYKYRSMFGDERYRVRV
ncbi:hypothetical protein C8R41DRAFT_764845 [Lentinula lateritia]|uniref:Uncharacterized protein n=1 Tax=Lentinula lateritia TaxID=40482 RepID=A0ABQ8VJH1_9AGAR|nr:hypothetical protein C8R41DRAFT_764845 [Lentinula lateritia]